MNYINNVLIASNIGNYIVYLLIRIIIKLVRVIPYKIKLFIVYRLLRFFIFLKPKYKKIGLINLKIVFPKLIELELNNLFDDHLKSLAKTIIDSLNLSYLGQDWTKIFINLKVLADIKNIKNDTKSGNIFLGGHLDSFEYISYVLSKVGLPISLVVRPFKNKYLNSWWNKIRTEYGNKVVDRSGAVKSLLKALRAGQNVGMLFDQNVTSNQAVFVNWFGVPAATTKAPAFLTLATKAPIYLLGVKSLQNNKFKFEAVKCNFDDIYIDKKMEKQEKIIAITNRLVIEYQKLILANPAAWFWLHRRWKSRPVGEPENIYN